MVTLKFTMAKMLNIWFKGVFRTTTSVVKRKGDSIIRKKYNKAYWNMNHHQPQEYELFCSMLIDYLMCLVMFRLWSVRHFLKVFGA